MAKTKARVRKTLVVNSRKRKAQGLQRPPDAAHVPPDAAPAPPVSDVAVPFIVAHRRAEKFPSIQVMEDGSYIRLSTNRDGTMDMRAICAKHSYGHGSQECNLSRTCRPSKRLEGRPLGLMMWFFNHHLPEDKAGTFLGFTRIILYVVLSYL